MNRIGNLRQWYDLGLGLVCCGRKPNLKARLALEDLLSIHLPSFSSHLVAPPWLSESLYHISALRSSTLQTVTVSTIVNSNHPQTQYQGRIWKRGRYDSGCLIMTRSGSVMISYDCSGDDNWLISISFSSFIGVELGDWVALGSSLARPVGSFIAIMTSSNFEPVHCDRQKTNE